MQIFGTAIGLNCLRFARNIGAFLLLLTLTATFAHAEEKDLISSLSSKNYREREAAYKKLRAMGSEARPLLLQGLETRQLETRLRCQTLLNELAVSTLAKELLEFRIAGEDAKKIPKGWEKFSKVFGKEVSARILFTLVCEQDPELIESLEDPKANHDDLVAVRCHRIMQKATPINRKDNGAVTSGEIAAVIYAGASAKKLSPTTFQLIYSAFTRPGVKAYFPRTKQIESALTSIMKGQTSNSSNYYQKVYLATNLQLQEYIEDHLKKEIEESVDEALVKFEDVNRLQQVVSVARQLGMTDTIENKIKPGVREILREIAKDPKKVGGWNTMTSMVYTARNINMENDLNTILRPAFLEYVKSYDDSKQVSQLVYLARAMNMENEVVDALAENFQKRLLEILPFPDRSELQAIQNDARYLNNNGRFNALLKPAIREFLWKSLSKKINWSELRMAFSMAKQLEMEDLLNEEAKPFIVAKLTDLDDSLSLSDMLQLSYIGRDLQMENAVARELKPSLKKYFEKQNDNKIDSSNASQALSLIQQLNIKEAIPYLYAIAKEKSVASYYRGRAIHLVGILGEPKEINKLREFLDDDSALSGASINGVQLKTQMRDVALACMLHLKGKSLAEYGYDYAQIVQLNFDSMPNSCLGFSSDERRRSALQKWQELEEKSIAN